MIERKGYFYGAYFWLRFDGRFTGLVHTCSDGERKFEVESEETEYYGFWWTRERKVMRKSWVSESELRICNESTMPEEEILASLKRPAETQEVKHEP